MSGQGRPCCIDVQPSWTYAQFSRCLGLGLKKCPLKLSHVQLQLSHVSHVKFRLNSFDSGWWCLIWDQLFGLLATAMRYCDILCDEEDLCQHLGIELLKFHWSCNCVDCLVSCNQVWKSKPPEGMSSCWLAMSGKSAICWIASMFEHGLVHSVRFKLHILIQSGTGNSGALPALLTGDCFCAAVSVGNVFQNFHGFP